MPIPAPPPPPPVVDSGAVDRKRIVKLTSALDKSQQDVARLQRELGRSMINSAPAGDWSSPNWSYLSHVKEAPEGRSAPPLFALVDTGVVLLKNPGDAAMEMILAATLFEGMEVRVAGVRVLPLKGDDASGDDDDDNECARIHRALNRVETLYGHDKDYYWNKLTRKSAGFLVVMEYVPGRSLQSVGRAALVNARGELSSAGCKVLQDMGKIAVVDLLLCNSDRLPMIGVYDHKQSNLGNFMVASNGHLVAIDQEFVNVSTDVMAVHAEKCRLALSQVAAAPHQQSAMLAGVRESLARQPEDGGLGVDIGVAGVVRVQVGMLEASMGIPILCSTQYMESMVTTLTRDLKRRFASAPASSTLATLLDRVQLVDAHVSTMTSMFVGIVTCIGRSPYVRHSVHVSIDLVEPTADTAGSDDSSDRDSVASVANLTAAAGHNADHNQNNNNSNNNIIGIERHASGSSVEEDGFVVVKQKEKETKQQLLSSGGSCGDGGRRASLADDDDHGDDDDNDDDFDDDDNDTGIKKDCVKQCKDTQTKSGGGGGRFHGRGGSRVGGGDRGSASSSTSSSSTRKDKGGGGGGGGVAPLAGAGANIYQLDVPDDVAVATTKTSSSTASATPQRRLSHVQQMMAKFGGGTDSASSSAASSVASSPVKSRRSSQMQTPPSARMGGRGSGARNNNGSSSYGGGGGGGGGNVAKKSSSRASASPRSPSTSSLSSSSLSSSSSPPLAPAAAAPLGSASPGSASPGTVLEDDTAAAVPVKMPESSSRLTAPNDATLRARRKKMPRRRSSVTINGVVINDGDIIEAHSVSASAAVADVVVDDAAGNTAADAEQCQSQRVAERVALINEANKQRKERRAADNVLPFILASSASSSFSYLSRQNSNSSTVSRTASRPQPHAY